MKKLFLILFLVLICFNLSGLEYVETQDDGAMVYCTYDVTEIEKALGIHLEQQTVIAKRHYDSRVENQTYLMIVYPSGAWQVITIVKDYMFIFISEDAE
jgi:hypothetical protein